MRHRVRTCDAHALPADTASVSPVEVVRLILISHHPAAQPSPICFLPAHSRCTHETLPITQVNSFDFPLAHLYKRDQTSLGLLSSLLTHSFFFFILSSASAFSFFD